VIFIFSPVPIPAGCFVGCVSLQQPSEPSLFPVFDWFSSGQGRLSSFWMICVPVCMSERAYEQRVLWWRRNWPVGECKAGVAGLMPAMTE
jgi:hypothetical protein